MAPSTKTSIQMICVACREHSYARTGGICDECWKIADAKRMLVVVVCLCGHLFENHFPGTMLNACTVGDCNCLWFTTSAKGKAAP